MSITSSLPIALSDIYAEALTGGYTGEMSLIELLNWDGWADLPDGASGIKDFLGVSAVVNSGPLLGIPVGDSEVFAYSTRNIMSDYDGSVVRLIRLVDDEESDFTATELTDGTATSWAGDSDLQLVRFYNQGNGNLDLFGGSSCPDFVFSSEDTSKPHCQFYSKTSGSVRRMVFLNRDSNTTTDLVFGTGDFTMVMQIKNKATSGTGVFMQPSTNVLQWRFEGASTNSAMLYFTSGGSLSYTEAVAGGLDQLVATRSDSLLEIYENTSLRGSKENTHNTTLRAIGSYYNHASYSFEGVICEMIFITRQLSEAEVSVIFSNASSYWLPE